MRSAGTCGGIVVATSFRIHPVCPTGKHSWVSKAAAKRSIKHQQSGGLGVKRAYRCGECGLWHLTTQAPRHSSPSNKRYQANRHLRVRGINTT